MQAKQIKPPPSLMKQLEKSQEYLSQGAPQEREKEREKEKQMKKRKELRYGT